MTAPTTDDFVAPPLEHACMALLVRCVARGDEALRRKVPTDCTASGDVLHALCAQGLCTPTTLVCAMALIERVVAILPRTLSSINATRVLLAAVMLASKAHADVFYAAGLYASTAALTTATVLTAERQFFERLQFNARVSRAELDATCAGMHVAPPFAACALG